MFAQVFSWIGKFAEWFRTLVPGEFMLGISYMDLIHFAAGLLTLGVLAICLVVSEKKEKKYGKGHGISDWRWLHILVTVFATSLLTMALSEHSILASWTMSHLQSQEANFYNYAEWPFLMKMTAWSVPVCAVMSIYMDGFRRRKPALILLTLLEIAMGILLAPLVMALQIFMSVMNYVLAFKVVIYGFPYLIFLSVFVLCVKQMLEETPEEYVAWKVRDEENRRLARHARWERDQAEQYRLEEERKAEAERRRIALENEKRRKEAAEREARRRRTEVPQFTMPVEEKPEVPQFTMPVEEKPEEPQFTMLVQDEE